MNAVRWIVDHPLEIREQVQRAYTWTKQRFNWDENLKNLEKTLGNR